MARPRSQAKQQAILEAALLEFAENGLAAPTAAIARRADVATGTLFTYFATKEELQNALYLHLKSDVYGRMNREFPQRGSLEARLRHLWRACLEWAIEQPASRLVSMQLNLSETLTPETRQTAKALSGPAAQALLDLETRGIARGLPPGFAAASMSHMQDAALQLLPTTPRHARKALIDDSFAVFWRILR